MLKNESPCPGHEKKGEILKGYVKEKRRETRSGIGWAIKNTVHTTVVILTNMAHFQQHILMPNTVSFNPNQS